MKLTTEEALQILNWTRYDGRDNKIMKDFYDILAIALEKTDSRESII